MISLAHELFMIEHYTLTLNEEAGYKRGRNSPFFRDLIASDNG